MLEAIKFTLQLEHQKVINHSDSLSVVQSIQQMYNNNPIVQNIQDNIHQAINNGQTIQIIWIPSHIGIRGNEDAAAKCVTNDVMSPNKAIPADDLKCLVKKHSKIIWNEHFLNLNILHTVPNPKTKT